MSAAGPGRAHEYLGPGEHADHLGLTCQAGEQSGCPIVMGIVVGEMGDQYAGVQDDHAGHSWRSASRSPGW